MTWQHKIPSETFLPCFNHWTHSNHEIKPKVELKVKVGDRKWMQSLIKDGILSKRTTTLSRELTEGRIWTPDMQQRMRQLPYKQDRDKESWASRLLDPSTASTAHRARVESIYPWVVGEKIHVKKKPSKTLVKIPMPQKKKIIPGYLWNRCKWFSWAKSLQRMNNQTWMTRKAVETPSVTCLTFLKPRN